MNLCMSVVIIIIIIIIFIIIIVVVDITHIPCPYHYP